MVGSTADLDTYGYALCAIAYGVFAALMLRRRPAGVAPGAGLAVFRLALVATSCWALATLWDLFSRNTAPAFVAAALDLLRYALLFAFLLWLLRPMRERPVTGLPHLLPLVTAAVIGASAAVLAWRISTGLYDADDSRPAIAAALSLPVFGLILIEQLFRNLAEDSRWNAKPLCIGLGVIFAFDLYLYAQAALFGHVDRDAVSIRGAAHAVALPLLFMASRRHGDWLGRLKVSRSAAFYSTTLLLVGGYLLFMSAVGYYIRYFGGDWGRALQLGLLAAGLAFLITLVFSGAQRARVRVFVNKHFFSYRYDYREEWLRFTAMLSSTGTPQEVGAAIVRGLAGMVECPGGSLWTREQSDGEFRQASCWNAPTVDAREPADSPFAVFLRQVGWVIDIAEYRHSPRRYTDLVLPTWAVGDAELWLVAPLFAGEELLGYVTLLRPRAPLELDWEVRDLLKTASRQAAGILAQMRATEALLEARKFDAFNRMSAFVVHDLKNIVTQLSLMMKNAQRLHANPEFQQDMLLTVENSLEKMRRLMLQLREGAAPPGGTHGVELAPILERLAAMARARGRQIHVEAGAGLATRGHEERLERVLGHLAHNALDATPEGGRVWVVASRDSGRVKIEVGDTGAGMNEEFVRQKLFRPFSSTKHSGMGIGSYESFQYIRELGGSIDVDSEPGRGSVFTLLLPLFEAHSASQLGSPDLS